MYSEFVETYRSPESQAVAEYRVERPLQAVSRQLESELRDLRRAGSCITTVHPDTGMLAQSQEYSGQDAQLDIMHRDDPESNGYIAEIYIAGSRERVEELEHSTASAMEKLSLHR